MAQFSFVMLCHVLVDSRMFDVRRSTSFHFIMHLCILRIHTLAFLPFLTFVLSSFSNTERIFLVNDAAVGPFHLIVALY